jgi:putative ABC transport system permease protein
MFARLVYESFRRQKRRKLLAGVAITLGVAVTTAMIGVATDIGDKISRELRTVGANLVVTSSDQALDVKIGGVNLKPANDGGYLNEADLPKIKTMFWRNNIVGFAPMLPVTVSLAPALSLANGSSSAELVGTYFARSLRSGTENFVTGVRTTHPLWNVDGSWPDDGSRDILVGQRLAEKLDKKPSDVVQLDGRDYRVAGILSTSGPEDERIFAPLPVAQQLLRRPGAMQSVEVSAITKPEDDFARRDPTTLKGAVYDRWYCSPYATSIAFQLQEVIPNSRAEQIRQVAQNEGTVLSRIQGLMLLVALAALIAAALAVSSAMATAILERRGEVGLMRALGAGSFSVGAMFLAEATLLALIGGSIGFAIGTGLAHQIGIKIFDQAIVVQPVLFPYILGMAVLVTFAGSALSIRKALRFDPVRVLRGDA